MLFVCALANAQIPAWKWARDVGGNNQEDFTSSGTKGNTVQMDTAGNVYEAVYSASSTIAFGPYSFTNPSSSIGTAAGYFVKYNSQGIVMWAKQFPQYPAAVGGGPITPTSMFTDDQGYSSLLFPYLDSIRLGTMFFRDSTIHRVSGGVNYCMARYDPAGNVVSLKAYQCSHSGITSIQRFYGNQILGLGLTTNTGDTLNGHPLVGRGYFFAIMDSAGAVQWVKNIGYDTATALVEPQGIVVGNKSVFVFMRSLWSPAINQATIPTAGLVVHPSNTRLLVKFDSLLNFQWFKTTNGFISFPMAADQQDNVFLSTEGSSQVPSDTMAFDTILIPWPVIRPGQYGYLGIIKVNGSGSLQWSSSFLNTAALNQAQNAMCTDHLGNVYGAGKYDNQLNVGYDTLTGAGNVYVAKLAPDGTILWGRNTQNAGVLQLRGIAEDSHGNIVVNGIYADAHKYIHFGSDSFVCHTSASGQAADVFTARLGNCAPSVPGITASSSLQWCGMDSVSLTASAGQTYLWSNGDTSRSILVKSTGTYYIYAVDSMGCYARSTDQHIKANPNPNLSATVIKEVSCFGGSDGKISVQVTTGTPPYRYSYTPAIADTDHVSIGTYVVTATDTAGCVATDTLTITQPSTALSIHTDTVPTSAAGSGEAIVIATGATPPYSYLWSSDPVQSTDTAIHLTAGWYTVTVTDINGCRQTDSAYVRLYTTGIADIRSDMAHIYPNPATDVFYIEATTTEIVKAYDMAGKIIMNQMIQPGTTPIQAGTWSSGTYQIVIGNSKYRGVVTIYR